MGRSNGIQICDGDEKSCVSLWAFLYPFKFDDASSDFMWNLHSASGIWVADIDDGGLEANDLNVEG